MGVKVKLADGREVGGVRRKAGDVVEVDPGEARALEALNAAVRVDNKARKAAAPAAAGNTKKAAASAAGAERKKG